MKQIKLQTVRYSPGYGDMLGGGHSTTLKRDKDGSWIMVCRDREVHSEPTTVITYSVSEEAVTRLEEFIDKNKVIGLSKRPNSDLFATDYSPWSWNINYETTLFGKTKRDYCSFAEYKRYSKRDYELLKELEKQFSALRGKKISETTEQ